MTMASELEGVTIGRTGVPERGGEGAVPNTRAFILDPQQVHGPRESLLVGTEFGHVHPEHDGSLHLCLPDEIREEVLAAGWGETHPLAGRSVKGFDVPPGNTPDLRPPRRGRAGDGLGPGPGGVPLCLRRPGVRSDPGAGAADVRGAGQRRG